MPKYGKAAHWETTLYFLAIHSPIFSAAYFLLSHYLVAQSGQQQAYGAWVTSGSFISHSLCSTPWATSLTAFMAQISLYLFRSLQHFLPLELELRFGSSGYWERMRGN